MPALNHPYFGQLDSNAAEDDPDVIWEGGADLNGRAVPAELWVAAEARLDAAFAAAMVLHSIALWHQDPLEEGSSPLVLDYMIDPDNSDAILAVSVAADGEIEAVDWES